MKRSIFNLTLLAALILILAALPALAQGVRVRQGRGMLAQSTVQPARLAPLKRALVAAGAPELTSGQETSIIALITNFRASHTAPGPNTALQSARVALDNAILAGKYDSASAGIIVTEMTANAAARIRDLAGFAIGVLQVLDKTQQVDALVKRLGSDRTVRLVESLAAGPALGGRARQAARAVAR